MLPNYPTDNIQYLAPHRAVAVSSEWRQVAAANPDRRALFIVNTSDTLICLAIGDRPDQAVPAGQERGISLNADGGAFNMTDDNLTLQAVYARHGGTGDKNLAVQEAEALEVP